MHTYTGEYSFICLLCSIHPWNTSPFVCCFPYTQGNTAPFVCYLPYTQGNTDLFVCYSPYTQGIQLHLFVNFRTPKEIQLQLFVIFHIHTGEYSFICLLFSICTQGNTASFVCDFPYTHRGIHLGEYRFTVCYFPYT